MLFEFDAEAYSTCSNSNQMCVYIVRQIYTANLQEEEIYLIRSWISQCRCTDCKCIGLAASVYHWKPLIHTYSAGQESIRLPKLSLCDNRTLHTRKHNNYRLLITYLYIYVYLHDILLNSVHDTWTLHLGQQPLKYSRSAQQIPVEMCSHLWYENME